MPDGETRRRNPASGPDDSLAGVNGKRVDL